MSQPRLSHCLPVLPCEDIHDVLAFCSQRLGFEREWVWGEPPTDACVKRDDVRLMFTHNPDLCARVKGSELIVFVAGVDSLYAEHLSRQAPIVSELSDKPWRIREYTVELPMGYLLRFAESIDRIEQRGTR